MNQEQDKAKLLPFLEAHGVKMEPWQMEMVQRLVEADLGKLEQNIITHGMAGHRIHIGVDPGGSCCKATMCVARMKADVLIIDDIVDLSLGETEALHQKLMREGKVDAWSMEPFLAILDTDPVPVWEEPAKVIFDRKRANRRTKDAKKPLPYYHGQKRRF